ncbi:MAG: DUF2254 domain-containing protein [SAR324 cluster bacterium]|nr:DUF2254 domain-containing protein [SAR324 cluster bacterium]
MNRAVTKQSKPSDSSSAKQTRFSPFAFLRTTAFRAWVVPCGFVGGLSVSIYIALRFVDFSQGDGTIPFSEVVFLSNPDDVGDAIGGVAEVLIAILGLVITVVAIVVQLAAQRYTPKLVELFIADRVNISYFVLMVVASLYSMMVIYSTTSGFLPFWGSLALLGMTTVILSLLIPYFNYVFHFLTPGNFIRIIRHNAKSAMQKVLKTKAKTEEVRRLQTDVANSMEQISDICLSAVSQMDRNVALMTVRSLKDVMVDHLLMKRRMPRRWFVPNKEHFPAISSDFIHELYVGRNWVEMKGFLDMELIFKMAIRDTPDAVSAIANSTKIIGLYAIKLKDNQVLHDVIQFFNTFLRHAVNARNPKAIYNLFYQYRMLAEEVLVVDRRLAERIAFYFKYYGQIAQSYNIPLILITASFDLAHLLRRAYEMQVPNINTLMDTFLEVDDNPATQANEFDLRSVRKAQLMFASFLLSQGDDELIHRIVDDMKVEPQSRMEAVRQEMLAVKDRKFWEVTDRGVDFFYMDDEQKHYLNEFFTRFIEPQFAQPEPQLRVQRG